MLTKLLGKWLFGLGGITVADAPLPNAIVTTASWIITVTFAFIVNKKYVFHSETTEKGDLWHEILTFYGARKYNQNAERFP